MNFDFSDDQKLVQDQTRRFLSERCGPEVVRTVLDGHAPYAESVWRGLAEMGLMGTGIPESHGGAGAGYLELCLVAQELGAALAPVPFGSTIYLTAEALLLWGSEEQKSRLLPGIASGALKGALAVVETLEQTTLERIETRFDQGALHGTKLIVPDGGIADLLVVLATGPRGPGLYLVDLREASAARENVSSVDPTRNTARIDSLRQLAAEYSDLRSDDP